MKNIVKSFYNYMLTFWYQFLAFILFVVIASALTIGFISNSLQIIAITNQINQTEKQWDYDIDTYFGEFDDDFIYDYFENDPAKTKLLSEKNPLFNSFNSTLLNLEAKVDGNQSLKEYLEQARGSEKASSFIGRFIRRNVFSNAFLTDHKVLLPKIKDGDRNKLVDFFEIVNPVWQKLTANMFGQVYHLIDNDLTAKYHQIYPNDDLEISYNRLFKYRPSNTDQIYSFEPINLGLINNVVSNLSQNRLSQMKDNEILINDKFAKARGWKIGDTIKAHDFMVLNQDQDKYRQVFNDNWFNNEYTIIGWGMKIQNLFADFELFNPDFVDNTSNAGFFYLTNREFDRYWNYLWFYNNLVTHQDGSKQRVSAQTLYYQRLKVQNSSTEKNFNNYVGRILKTPSMANDTRLRLPLRIVFGYHSLYFAQAFQLYLIEAIIFTFIGLISLIFAMLFINYAIKKQLRQMRRQLGLFKSLGYGTIELSTALWSRTYVLLMIGFIIGYLISIPIQIVVNHILVPNFYVIVQEIWINPYFLLTIFLIVPMVLSLLNFAAIIRYLRKNALAMIYMDKNFSLGSQYGKTLSWMLRTHSLKMGKWQINFSWKQFFMALFIPLFFMFGSLLLMIQFNVKTLMTSTVDFNSHVYQNSINYSIRLENDLSWRKNETKFILNDPNFENFHYVEYNQQTDLEAYHNTILDQAINRYLDNQDINQRLLQLFLISQQDLNHKAVSLNQILKLCQQLVADFEANPDIFEKFNLQNEIRNLKNLLGQAEMYQERLANPNVQLTINNAFIKQNQDYPILKLELFDYNTSNVVRPWNFFLVNDYNRNIFVNLDYSTLVNKTQQQTDQKLMPVIISEQFSLLNHKQIGDEIETYLNYSGSNTRLRFKVVGINRDKVSSNFYGLESYFFQNFVRPTIDSQVDEIKPIFNTIYSKGNLFDPNVLNWNTAMVNNDYFNFYYPTADEKITVETLLKNSNLLVNYFNWENLTTSNFQSLAVQRFLANETISDIISLINILLGFTFLLLLTLFVVFFILGTVDNQLQIKLLKAFGYTQNYISTRLLRRHIISITLGVVFGIIINYFVWDLIINWLFKAFGILLYNPFTISWTIISTLIIVLLFFSGSMITFAIVKKTSPVIKTL